ncbi:N-acetyl-gamma-glutamyl-phosphate reductase [Roseovarius aestuarii]|nr:N-acetyl-gamma-glutamyl-phosphate reductase [Roseovarius aestuarii]
MVSKVFIDGEVGTTGLQIRDRLAGRDDITLISLDDTLRKDLDARVAAFEAADIAILCLPDDAVVDIVTHLGDRDTRLIDASTAHRVNDAWVYGYPELSSDTRARIASAARVSNPGCYSTGSIALLHPLVAGGVIAPDASISIGGVSGYTGGGKALIAEFESGETDGFFAYATGQHHKHIPEIIKYGGLSKRPIFVPAVGNYAQGMIIQIPLPFMEPAQQMRLHDALAHHYDGSQFVKVVAPETYGARVDPRRLNDTNMMELSVHGDVETGCVVLFAVLDNLGKGASGAAVQNLNIMLGLDESVGL